ncbi:glycosyltransferase family 2 protein [Pelagibacterium luteolum]|uniref:Glycosyl transferase family 2 n=1 Tax=Pelagibacterium luteolum TaxID=440168 RepID=A0A1G7XX59_9HYPH|nr:glycosyltransferase family 2 protein [Pelagibacterium luteolum]SDG88340.1 Glycosyl transferase family 2 [Pelagibacterium luteolum]
MPATTTSSVAVLLATYNGARFLDDQLASMRDQTHDQIDVFVSDDGSTDATGEMLSRWSRAWTKGKFSVAQGPRKGFSENFRTLVTAAPTGYAGYCFADQDDVWLVDKLERALAAIKAAGPRPVLYGARTRLIDQAGAYIGLSPLFERPMSFSNALVQSMAGGNTMMLNGQAFALLAESARRTSFLTHDWWAYIMVTACGGEAIYDPVPSLLYRQHETNIVGKNSGLRATARRIQGVANGKFRSWAQTNIEGLETCSDMMTPEARDILERWKAVHNAPPPLGLLRLPRSGVYRQNLRGNAMLYLASVMGWL